ncbi:unnamed protein product [Rotaria sp. Silwood1]|nr:unnamed protein product [Rotaria sp. Silwood1]
MSTLPPIAGEVAVSGSWGLYSIIGTAWGIAVDAESTVFVSDCSMNRVMQWSRWSSSGWPVAGSSSGTAGSDSSLLSCPMGIYLDQNSTLYIADRGNGRIQKWPSGSSSGITVAGANGQISSPTDVSVDTYGTVYVLSSGGLYRFNPGSTWGTVVISFSTVSFGFKFDSIGNVYVADHDSGVVRQYEAICCPFRLRTTFRRVRRIIILCWLCSLIIAIPQLFIFEQSLIPKSLTKYRCASTGYTAEWQRRIYFTIFACYVLIIPAICMTICYIKIIHVVISSKNVWIQKIQDQTTTTILPSLSTSFAKVKTVQLAMTIIIVFVVCWTPYIVITLIEIYSNGYLYKPLWLDGVLQIICLTQSSLNPFIYIIFNHKRKHSSTIVLVLARTSLQISRRRI